MDGGGCWWIFDDFLTDSAGFWRILAGLGGFWRIFVEESFICRNGGLGGFLKYTQSCRSCAWIAGVLGFSIDAFGMY